MKNSKCWLAICLTFTFSLMPINALADFEFSYHPSICEAITNQQADRLRWQVDGLKNEDPSMALWVNCPVPLQFRGENTMIIEAVATNESEQSVEVLCEIKRTVDGETRSSRKVTILDVGERANVAFVPLAAEEIGRNHLLQCKLPPGVIINEISGAAGYI